MRRNPISLVNMNLLTDPPKPGETIDRQGLSNFMREDEDDNDFASDVYTLADSSAAELHAHWRIFTELAGKTQDGVSRRLENAAWRLEGMRKAGRLNTNSASSNDLQALLLASTTQQPKLPSSSSSTGEQKSTQRPSLPKHSTGLTASSVLSLCIRHGWSDDCLDDLLACVSTPGFNPTHLPSSAALLRSMPTNQHGGKVPQLKLRPICAVFTHSMQRNGANNFCFFLVSRLIATQRFVVFAPSEGPMRGDFEKLGCDVIVIDTKAPGFIQDLEARLIKMKIGLLVANTIMRSDIVTLASRMELPTVWVIHESWPQDKLEYYAQEVFLRKDLTADIIKTAFAKTDCVVFPSEMQKNIYKGLFRPDAGATVYNGIPLTNLDQYQKTADRNAVRKSLGYTPDDYLVLHLGTICGRKGQVYTAKAASKLMTTGVVPNMKVLMVGARYIRDHEIAYIDHIKDEIESSGLTWARFEDTDEEDRGKSRFTFMDIQSSVVRFYLAADVVLVPSLNEVLPLVIGEAMAFRKPVICSAIDAIPEAVTDGVDGCLIPPADPEALGSAIKKIYDNPRLAQQLGEAGRKRVERQFSYAFMCLRYREIMDVVASKQGRAHAKSNPAIPTTREVRLDDTPSSSPVTAEKRELKGAPPNLLSTATPSIPVVPVSTSSVSLAKLAGRTILVDMDNTLVDWDKEFIKRYCAITGANFEDVAPLVRNRKFYEIEKNPFGTEPNIILQVVKEKNFYASLEPFPGALNAMKQMVEAGVDVRLVTSPHPACPASCSGEKYTWLLEHLGEAWVDRLIIARDKTHVQGDLLIDDKPIINGSSKHVSWKQVLFSQSYNKDVELGGRTRLSSWSTEDWATKLLSSLN